MSNFTPMKPNNQLNEAKRRATPEEVDRAKREKIKEALDVAKERIKSTPHNAKFYQAKMRYLEAQMAVLDAYKMMLKAKD